MAMKCSVFVLSCNRIVRESIERLIRKRADLDLLGAQSAHADSVNSVIESGAEVLLVDSLPFVLEPNGWPAAPQAERQRVKVILIAMRDDKKLFLSAVKHGVTGYVLQDSPSIDVINAIRVVASGQSVCPPNFTRVLFDVQPRERLLIEAGRIPEELRPTLSQPLIPELLRVAGPLSQADLQQVIKAAQSIALRKHRTKEQM